MTTAPRSGTRFHELDALRGIAAMSVVLLHFRNLYVPDALADVHSKRTLALVRWSWPLLTGGEAVVLFFVLSGFVLMLPYLKGRSTGYWLFFRRRLLRIYGPYFVALVIAVGAAAVLHTQRGGTHGLQAWGDNIWSEPISPGLVADHVFLIGRYNWHQFNPAFWTLIVEMRVSFVFPLLAALVQRWPVWRTLVLAFLCSFVSRMGMRFIAGAESVNTLMLEYIGIFLVGMALAKSFSRVEDWFQRQPWLWRVGLFALALGLYLEAHRSSHGSSVMLAIASAGLIVVAVSSRTVRRLLQAPPLQVLGRWSYSLYLIHIPILLSLSFLLAGRLPHMEVFALYLMCALLAAGIFYRLVEKPFTALSRRVGASGRPQITGNSANAG